MSKYCSHHGSGDERAFRAFLLREQNVYTFKDIGKILGGVTATRAAQLVNKGRRLKNGWHSDLYNDNRFVKD